MKLAIMAGPMVISEAEEQRLSEFYALRKSEDSAKLRAQSREQQMQYLQSMFVYLFCAVVVGAAIYNRYEISHGASRMTTHVSSKIKNLGNSASLRQNTLQYEQEVTRITENH